MQLRQTIPLTSVLSPKGRGSKPSPENESPFGERDSPGANDQISSPLGGEGRVRGVFKCIDTAETHQITVGGLPVQIVRKDIKNLHLGVYPPQGRVRVAAPLRVGDKAVRLAVIGKLGWIKHNQARFANQRRQSAREMVTGESHYFLGQRYRLRVIRYEGGNKVVLRNKSIIEVHVPAKASVTQRGQVLQVWYRQQLRELVPPLLGKWQVVLGVEVPEWNIKKMKTRWGSCNPDACRIWLNLELAKKPVKCLEYILVHELVHLMERHHNDRFVSIMDKYLPQWRLHRQELNSEPLAHETWSY